MFWFIVFLAACQAVFAQEAVVFRGKPHGMFSVFQFVLYYLQQYEQNKISGLYIDFADKGLYYDPQLGSNWWEYYFEEIRLSPSSYSPIHVVNEDEYVDPSVIEFNNSYQDNHALINKYIKVKRRLLNKVSLYYAKNFANHYVIGIHYRGTDKLYYEAKRVNYNDVIEALNECIANIPEGKSYKIFVATDEYLFLHYMLYRYGDKVCFREIKRSLEGVPIHIDQNRNPYQAGEDALIDMLLLSRVNFLIRTSSNLSLCSRFFKPNLPVIELSQRSDQTVCSGIVGSFW